MVSQAQFDAHFHTFTEATADEFEAGTRNDVALAPTSTADFVAEMRAGALRVADKATATTLTVPAATKYIQTAAYDEDVSSTRGGALYRESNLSEVGSYPSASWFQTANSRYFLLAEPVPTAEHLGGSPDAVLNGTTEALTSGTDSFAAITALIAFMGTANTDGHLGAGIYYSSAEVINNSGRILRGAGPDETTLHVKLTVNNKAATLLPPGTASGGFADMCINMEATLAKAANNGQYYACVGVGGEYFFSDAPDEVTGFTLENLKLTRADTISSGSAIALTGYVTGGRIHNITARGTKRTQAMLVAMHWSGLGGPYGSAVTETYHVGDITLSGLDGEGSNIPLSLSATYNINVMDTIGTKGCLQPFVMLPGDETNRLAVAAQKELIGRGHYINGIFIEDLGSSSDPAIDIFGNGQSPFAFFASPDGAVGLQEQLYMELTIGSITGKNTTPQARELLQISKWVGDLSIGKIDVGDSFTTLLVDIADSDGVRIENLRGAATFTGSGAITVTNSCRNIYINGGKVKQNDVDTAANRVLYIEGGTTNLTLSADASAAATEIFVTGSVGVDVVINTPLTVNGHLVWTTAYVESACTRIPITALPVSCTTGQAVVIDRSTEFDIRLDMEGGGRSCEFNTCRGRLAGRISGSGEQALRFETGAKVLLDHFVCRGSGRGRIANGSLATREIVVGDSANVVALGGRYGLDAEFVDLNIEISGSSTNDRRLVMIGSEFAGQGISGYVGGTGNETDYELINCYTTAGAPVGTGVGTAATGVTARELGARRSHQTILTVNTTLPAIAGGASLAVGKLLYTFPAGVIVVESARMALAITQTQGFINADTPDGGLGTTLGSGAVATLDLAGAGAENILTGQTFNNCTGTVEDFTVSNQVLTILSGSNHTVYFNVADGWAASGDAAALLTGTVTLNWRYLGA